MAFFAAGYIAVSYTHLDVYKRQPVYLLKERWCTEAAYQESKQQLGMDEYQGRLYPGLQHHLTSVLCTLLIYRR